MLFGETVAVCCENHAEHTRTLRGQSAEYFSVKAVGIHRLGRLSRVPPFV
jgi:hypothetical protein